MHSLHIESTIKLLSCQKIIYLEMKGATAAVADLKVLDEGVEVSKEVLHRDLLAIKAVIDR